MSQISRVNRQKHTTKLSHMHYLRIRSNSSFETLANFFILIAVIYSPIDLKIFFRIIREHFSD